MDRVAYHKLGDWQMRLLEWAAGRVGAPFEWGNTDCAVLCAEAFDAMVGTSFAEELRGAYATIAEALRYQRRVNNLWDGLHSAGCKPLISPLGAEIGDFFIARSKGFWCGHVCLGSSSLSSTPEAGVAIGETSNLQMLPSVRVLRVP